MKLVQAYMEPKTKDSKKTSTYTPADTIKSTVWDFFDDIVCLNLLSREDRYQAAIKTFKELQIPARFHRVKKNPQGGEAGCFISHLEIIREAYDAGHQQILVFEDDAIASKDYSLNKVNRMIHFLKGNQDWDMFFLGYSHNYHNLFFSNMRPIDKKKDIFKIEALGLFAYVINRKYMKYILDQHAIYQGTALDIAIYQKGNHYAIYPMIIKPNFQLGSDIEHTDLGSLNDPLVNLIYSTDQYIGFNSILEKLNRYFKWIIIALIIFVSLIIYSMKR